MSKNLIGKRKPTETFATIFFKHKIDILILSSGKKTTSNWQSRFTIIRFKMQEIYAELSQYDILLKNMRHLTRVVPARLKTHGKSKNTMYAVIKGQMKSILNIHKTKYFGKKEIICQ